MLEIPHTIVGAAIGLKISNPLISLPLAFISHFILDFIPHWNPSLYTETKKAGQPTKKSTIIVVTDTLLSLVIGFVLAAQVWPNLGRFITVIFACFLAVLPDVIESPFFFFNFKHPFLEKLVEFQHNLQGRTSKIPGLLVQVATVVIALIFALS